MDKDFFYVIMGLKFKAKACHAKEEIDRELIELILSLSYIINLQCPEIFKKIPKAKIDKIINVEKILIDMKKEEMTENVKMFIHRIGTVSSYCQSMSEIFYTIHTLLTEMIRGNEGSIH